MADKKKVIKALMQCMSSGRRCDGCPYEKTVCSTTLNEDVLDLLKDHKPLKVITALKQCISADMSCERCPYEGTICTTTLSADILDLLEAEE